MTNSGSATLADNDQLRFVYDGTTVQDLKDMISNANGTAAYTYINYDFRSINGGKNDMNYYLNFTIGDATINSCGFPVQQHTLTDIVLKPVYNTGLVGTALINSPGDKNRIGSTATLMHCTQMP